MTRPVYSLDLSPRENRHVHQSIGRDIFDICCGATLFLLIYVIALLVMA